ncbi:hypothetical protein O3M35_000966 [Rhynocoris fuscipes]|uniref:Uncharacterized protein n=1 Tax=Rhynocoris fuscipes TaxID=488301 RepID=A0AAW1DR76_9HEMI
MIFSLYSWRFPLPYCSNKDTSSNESANPVTNTASEPEKLPLPDMNFVFEGKELLNNGNRDSKIRIESRPMIEDGFKRDTTVEYDMKKSISRTSFVGKDSAV